PGTKPEACDTKSGKLRDRIAVTFRIAATDDVLVRVVHHVSPVDWFTGSSKLDPCPLGARPLDGFHHFLHAKSLLEIRLERFAMLDCADEVANFDDLEIVDAETVAGGRAEVSVIRVSGSAQDRLEAGLRGPLAAI